MSIPATEKLRMLLLLFATFLSANLAADTEAKVIIAALDYPPFSIKNTNKGIASELIVEAFSASGLDVQLDYYPKERRNKLFMELAVDAHTPGRIHLTEEQAALTETVYLNYANVSFIYYPPNLDQETIDRIESIERLSDLNDLKVAVLFNSLFVQSLTDEGYQNLYHLESFPQILRFVKSGRAPVGVVVDISSLLLFDDLFKREESMHFKFTKPLFHSGGGIAFHKQHPRYQELSSKFKQGLEQIKQNGKYLEVMEAYYGQDNVPKESMTEDMRVHGVDHTRLDVFMSYARDEDGRIISP